MKIANTHSSIFLDKKIHQMLATKTSLGSVIYIILFIVLTTSTGMHTNHPGPVFLLGSIILASGLGRLALRYFSNFLIEKHFFLWKILFFTNIACGSLSWGFACAFTLFKFDLTLPSFAFLLATAGIASGSILSFAPVFRLVALHLTLLLTPAIAAMALSPDYTTALSFSLSMSLYLFYLALQGRKVCNAFLADLKKNDIIIQQKEALEVEKHKTVSALRTKERFLAMMSHEIRTPLNGILGASELIISEQNNPKLLEQAQIIHNAGNNLLLLFNDIMTFSEVEKQRINFEMRPFKLIDCVTESVRRFSEITRHKGLSLDFYVAPNIPTALIGDSLRIQQVLSNLLENAVKFTEKGGIKLTIVGNEQSEGNFKLDFVLSDTGIGVEDGRYKKIFEDFSQREDVSGFSQNGIGLGLSVCKKICEAMGGNIQVRSEMGKGSTFQFTIPLQIATLAPAPAQATMSSYHLLLAEDQVSNQKLTTAMLKKMGHTVDLAQDGAEAVQAVQNKAYHAVLMDCMMPNMDGFEATRQIRKTHPALPIIAVTANALEGDRDKCIQAGMNDYISKPVNMNSLRNMLNKYLSTANETRKTG